MSYTMMVFCRRSPGPLTRQQIGEEIVNGVFFERTPRFDPPLGSAEARSPEWDKLIITYADSKRPVVLRRSGAIEGIDEDIGEDFGNHSLDSALQRRLVESRQVYSLDVDRSSLTDEAWEMCDFTEKMIAERCDGLIYAPGDGIFDAGLRPVAKAATK